jgi:hypothetical protein
MILDVTRRPWEVWQDAERYLGHRTRSYSPFSADMDVDDAFHPQRGPGTFDLPTFRIPHDAGAYLSNGIGSALHALYRDAESFLLPVHPQTLTMLDEPALARFDAGPPITVVPSANVRTVFVVSVDGRPVEPHFLKLHYPRRLSRFTRRLRRPIIALQLWVADELTRVGAPFLPEVGGAVFGHDPRHAWGYLIREHRVAGAAGPTHTVPFFALHGTDGRAPADPTLLEQLIVRSGESATRFLTERIVRPMVRLWVDAAVEVGCALEMHGQNTLFQFSLDLRSTRVVYRDCGIYVDPTLRKARGLPDDLPPVNVIGRDVMWPGEQVFSLAYDSFAGHHALSFLARLAADRLGVAEEELRRAAREEFAARSAGARLLPESVYYYDDRIHPDGAFVLVDTNATPTWR